MTRSRELVFLHLEYGRRPFPDWHNRAYVRVLADVEKLLAENIISVEKVQKMCLKPGHLSFQALAHKLIKESLFHAHSRDARVRVKLSKFRTSILPGYLDRIVATRFRLVSSWCAPRVVAVVFRTYWNGWVTTARMKSLFSKTGQARKFCLLGCGCEVDSLHHYLLCDVFWAFIRRNRGGGLGMATCLRTWESALLLSSTLSDEDVVRLAAGLYGLYKTLNSIRFCSPCEGFCAPALLSQWTKRGVEGIAAAKSLSCRGDWT